MNSVRQPVLNLDALHNVSTDMILTYVISELNRSVVSSVQRMIINEMTREPTQK